MALRTLLVGLGGTGCEIVDRVAGMIRQNRDEEHIIECIGLDTDTNDLKNIRHIDVIAVSKQMTVENYLLHTPGWREWFPDTALIKKHNMINGAGQMRPLSRLAFLECMNSGRLGKLEAAIKRLNVTRGDVTPTNMRVMIVSSFAGGTGSGMFLHAAMYIRKYFRRNYGGEVLLRGLFALPDMFMQSTVDAIQKESKYANAYGSIRELNAVNEVTLSPSADADKIKISFDGLFSHETDRKSGVMPFDLMFFIDNINNAHLVLPSLNHYKELMADITYLQVYSPLAPRQDTVEDNRFVTMMQGEYKALYGTAGASGLEYPYRQMVEYCAKRAAVDSISRNWTFFDEEYKKAKKENLAQRNADPTIPELKRDEYFIKAVWDRIHEGVSLFNFIEADIRMKAGDGLPINRHETFFAQIISLIASKSENNEILDYAKANCEVNLKSLGDPGEMSKEVLRTEEALKVYKKQIEEAIARDRLSLVQSILCDNLSSIHSFNNGQYNVSELLHNKEKAVHPLSARMLLYCLRKLVTEGLSAAENETQTCVTETADYQNHDYNIRMKGVQDAITEASRLSNLTAVKFQPSFYAFKSEYARKSRQQRDNLDLYRLCALQKAVLSDVLLRLNFLIRQYELFFDSLPDIQSSLRVEAANLENRHENKTDLMTYIYAGPQIKRAVYGNLKLRTANEEREDVCQAIFTAMYRETCLALEERRKLQIDEEPDEVKSRRIAKMNDVFRNYVETHITEEVEKNNQSSLNLNVCEALTKHCELTGEDPKKILESVAQKGMPYLAYNDQNEISVQEPEEEALRRTNYVYSLTFWGIHPDTRKWIINANPGVTPEEYFTVGNVNTAPIVESKDRFSRYKIEYYKSAYGIALRDIHKFTETGDNFGVFYANYRNRILKMLVGDEKAITPHLNYHWHSRSYLPFINADKDQANDSKAAEALWLALAYGGIDLREDKGLLRFYSVLRNSMGEPVLWRGEKLESSEAYKLFLDFRNDEHTIRLAMKYENEFNKERGALRGKLMDSRFVNGLVSKQMPCKNAINFMCNIGRDPDLSEAPRDFEVLKNALEGLIARFCDKASADREEKEAMARDVKKAVFDGSTVSSSQPASREYQWFKDWI